MVGKARILLADDHTLVAEAIKRLLEPEFEVVAVVADGRSLVREALALKPDVALVDLNMPMLNGFDASVSPRLSIRGWNTPTWYVPASRLSTVKRPSESVVTGVVRPETMTSAPSSPLW